MKAKKKRFIESDELNQATRIIYEYIVTDSPFQELQNFCERFNTCKKDNTTIINEISDSVANVQSLISEVKPKRTTYIERSKKKTTKKKIELPQIGQPQTPEQVILENEWKQYYTQVSLLLIKILQERKFFSQILNFLKLSVSGNQYVIRLAQITTLIDCADIILQVGRRGNYEVEGIIEQMPLNQLILKIILSLTTIQEEDENFDDLFYSLQKQSSKENLKKIFAMMTESISEVDALTIETLSNLFKDFQDKGQYITLASMQKTREATLVKCRKEIIYNLLSLCTKQQYLFPEILLNLKPKQKQASKVFFKGLTVAFSPVLLTILQNNKQIKDVTDEMYLTVLNSDTLNYPMIELYYLWLEKQNYEKLDFKQLNVILQKLFDSLIQNFEKVANQLRLIYCDAHFKEFYRVMNDNYLILLRNEATAGEAHFVKAVQSFNLLKDKADQYKLKPIRMPKRILSNLEFKYKFVNYQYKTDFLIASQLFVKFLFQDLNQIKLPQIDIIDFITFQNDSFIFKQGIPPTDFQYFFCQSYIQYYLQHLYGFNIIVSEEKDGKINIIHFPIANYYLDFNFDEEEIIFQALVLINKFLSKQDFGTKKLNYYNMLCKLNELSQNTFREKNIHIKSQIQKIIAMVQ